MCCRVLSPALPLLWRPLPLWAPLSAQAVMWSMLGRCHCGEYDRHVHGDTADLWKAPILNLCRSSHTAVFCLPPRLLQAGTMLGLSGRGLPLKPRELHGSYLGQLVCVGAAVQDEAVHPSAAALVPGRRVRQHVARSVSWRGQHAQRARQLPLAGTRLRLV